MPKIVNHEERRAAIAEAAAGAIAEIGIDNVTMGGLAAAAGCTVGALPHYFDGKDEILVAALRYVLETIRARASKVAIDTSFDAVQVWLSILPNSARGRREWRVWLAFCGRAAYNDVLSREFRARYATGHTDTIGMLRAMQSMGSLPRDLDLERAAEGVTTMIDGLGVRATLEPKAWPRARLQTIGEDDWEDRHSRHQGNERVDDRDGN